MATGYWNEAALNSASANTMNFVIHIDMATSEWRELNLKSIVRHAMVKRRWHGYSHIECVLKWVDKIPNWMRLANPRGPAKCCICTEWITIHKAGSQ